MEEIWVHDPEKGADWHGYALRIALGFPDRYEIGMANLGFLWVQHLFNSFREVRCDRFFDANRQLKTGGRVVAVETGRPISDYDVVALSLSYEGGYAAVPRMLKLGGVEPLAAKRERGPLVVAGGVAAGANPEPITDFLDAVIVGEAEPVIDRFVELLIDARRTRSGLSPGAIRHELIGLESVYVPSAYRHRYRGDGTLEAVIPEDGAPEVVTAARENPIRQTAHSPVVAYGSSFSGKFLVEAGRGCPYGCRFCLARHTYGGFRESPGTEKAVACGLRVTNRVGIVGAAFLKSSGLRAACEKVLQAGGNISFSSIRIDPAALRLLRELGPALDIESISMAPEVATPRLAAVIGKDAARELDSFVASGALPNLKKLKLYFLIGVPGETESDVEEIAATARDVQIRTGWEVTVSVTPMIPKPFTPMQWAPFAADVELKRKRELLRERLAGNKRIRLKVESLRAAREQAVLSRGDRRLGAVLLEAADDPGNSLLKLMRARGIDPDFYSSRPRGEKEVFPWDTMSHGTDRATLYKDYVKSVEAAGADNERD